MKYLETAKVLQKEELNDNTYKLFIDSNKIAKNASPGQFVMVYLDNMLPRPISIFDAEKSTFGIVFKALGTGTKAMAKLAEGDNIKLLGPIGNGFPKPDVKRVAIVGGGLGTPPLHFLAKHLTKQRIKVDCYLGFRDKPILKKDFLELNVKVYISTDSGKKGHYKGNVIDLMREKDKQYGTIYACGPKQMLAELKSYAKEIKTPAYLSLEERMACGMGTCVGCVVKTEHGIYEKICTDGPVFPSQYVEVANV